MPDEQVAKINEEMSKYTGIKIGDLTENRTKLGDL